MANSYLSDVIITTEPKALSSPGGIALRYRENRTITVSVVPAEAGASRRIRAVSRSPYIATIDSEAVTNANDDEYNV